MMQILFLYSKNQFIRGPAAPSPCFHAKVHTLTLTRPIHVP